MMCRQVVRSYVVHAVILFSLQFNNKTNKLWRRTLDMDLVSKPGTGYSTCYCSRTDGTMRTKREKCLFKMN